MVPNPGHYPLAQALKMTLYTNKNLKTSIKILFLRKAVFLMSSLIFTQKFEYDIDVVNFCAYFSIIFKSCVKKVNFILPSVHSELPNHSTLLYKYKSIVCPTVLLEAP